MPEVETTRPAVKKGQIVKAIQLDYNDYLSDHHLGPDYEGVVVRDAREDAPYVEVEFHGLNHNTRTFNVTRWKFVSDPDTDSPELKEFRKTTAPIVIKYADANGWCDVFDAVMRKVGYRKEDLPTELIDVTVQVPRRKDDKGNLVSPDVQATEMFAEAGTVLRAVNRPVRPDGGWR